jgi:hypothetical protein
MRLRFYHIVLILAFLSFFSCSKELSYEGGAPLTGNPLPPPDSTGQASSKDTMYATIGGQKWVAANISANALSFSSTLVITGSSLTGLPTVGLNLSSSITPAGSPYDLGPVTSNNYGLYLLSATNVLTSTTGQLTILENNGVTKRVRGNFNFQAVNPTNMQTAQLDSGYFSVQVQ